MKVVHLNTNLNNTSAPYQLHLALLKNGIDSNLLIFNGCDLEKSNKPNRSISYKIKRKINAKKISSIMKKYSQIEGMPFSPLPIGLDISKDPLIQKSDLIIIHWVNGDYLSPNEIEKLIKTGKKIYIFCHDNNHFTGGCHVRLGCDGFKNSCGSCPQLNSKDENDITKQLIESKIKIYEAYDNLTILSPSKWMDKNVSESIVFKNKKHFILPNPINTEIFKPYNKEEARNELSIPNTKKVILIGIKANDKIPYNGMSYLYDVIEKIKNEDIYPVIFGVEEVTNPIIKKIHNIGFVRDRIKMAKLYSAADVYITTSLEDSFNQTVAECMACGTPVVAFNNGGIADIIDHKINGYLAKYSDSDDIIEGIKFVLNNNFDTVSKINNSFSFDIVANKFINIQERKE